MSSPLPPQPPSSAGRKDRPTRGRILYVIGSLDVGGTERHLARIAPRLAQRGWEISIYCLTHRGIQADAVARGGVNVIAPSAGPARPNASRLQRLYRLTLTASKLLTVLTRQRPQIVHFFLPGAYLTGAPLAMITRVPIRIMSRRSLNYYQSARSWNRRLEIWLHRRMTLILGNSQRILEQLVADEECDPKRLALIYNGIDLAPFEQDFDGAATRRALGIDEDALVLVIVANLIPYKGHADLVEALGRIANDLPQPWTLLCAGRDDGCGGELRELSQKLGVSAQIRFLGSRHDVPQLLHCADIAILCSHEEGFSNAIIEGMAAGLPMIVTDVGGNTEAVREDVDGLVVPARAPEALAKAILALAQDPAKRKRLGANGRARATSTFGIEACVSEYDETYLRLIEKVR
ncbi:MAG: glycosyltransferase [Hyphomicrobiaceae bacterium]